MATEDEDNPTVDEEESSGAGEVAGTATAEPAPKRSALSSQYEGPEIISGGERVDEGAPQAHQQYMARQQAAARLGQQQQMLAQLPPEARAMMLANRLKLSQQEEISLQRKQNAIGAVKANSNLNDGEKQELIMQLELGAHGVDAMLLRKHKADAMAAENKNKLEQADLLRRAQNAQTVHEFNASKLMSRVVGMGVDENPETEGQTFATLDHNGDVKFHEPPEVKRKEKMDAEKEKADLKAAKDKHAEEMKKDTHWHSENAKAMTFAHKTMSDLNHEIEKAKGTPEKPGDTKRWADLLALRESTSQESLRKQYLTKQGLAHNFEDQEHHKATTTTPGAAAVTPGTPAAPSTPPPSETEHRPFDLTKPQTMNTQQKTDIADMDKIFASADKLGLSESTAMNIRGAVARAREIYAKYGSIANMEAKARMEFRTAEGNQAAYDLESYSRNIKEAKRLHGIGLKKQGLNAR